jgi:hypothetical protein
LEGRAPAAVALPLTGLAPDSFRFGAAVIR